ncbi:hypothetical protein, partial [Xanthomonas graminis]
VQIQGAASAATNEAATWPIQEAVGTEVPPTQSSDACAAKLPCRSGFSRDERSRNLADPGSGRD